MVRPVTIRETPNFHPYVCIVCGVGGPPRQWFVDIGINLDNYFNPVIDGTVFFCNECWDSVQVGVAREAQIWKRDREAWTGQGKVEPTYEWERRGNELPGVDSESSSDDPGTEPDDSEPEHSDSGDADTTDDPSSDESTKRAFSAILGEG